MKYVAIAKPVVAALKDASSRKTVLLYATVIDTKKLLDMYSV